VADPFTQNLGLDATQAPLYELPEIGFTDALGTGVDEAQSSLSYNIIGDLTLPSSTSQAMDEDDWKNSPFFREGLEYRPNMNFEWAQSLADTYDQNIELSQLHDRMTFGGEIGAFTGGMAAGLLDPINLLALPAGVTAGLVRTTGSKILGGAFAGALTNAAVETALAPFRVEQSDVLQTEYGLNDYLLDVGLSAGLGGGFGAVGGAIARLAKTSKDTPDPFTPVETGPTDAGPTPQTPIDSVSPTPRQDAPEGVEAPVEARDGTVPPNDPAIPVRAGNEQVTYDPVKIARELTRSWKGTDAATKVSRLMDQAKSLPREVFAQILSVRKSAKNNQINWNVINDMFQQLSVEDSKILRHLSPETIGNAIWDKINNGTEIDAHHLFNNVEPASSVQVLKSANEADSRVSPDRYVVIDEISNEITGTPASLARSAQKIMAEVKDRGQPIIINMSDQFGDSRTEVPIKELENHLNQLREDTGIANVDRIENGEEIITNNILREIDESKSIQLDEYAARLQHLYAEDPTGDIATKSDPLLSRVETVDDLEAVIADMRGMAGEDPTLNNILDQAADETQDVKARSQALRDAAICILGGK